MEGSDGCRRVSEDPVVVLSVRYIHESSRIGRYVNSEL